MPEGAGDVTQILEAIKKGDDGAQGRLFTAVYDELKRIAQRKMAKESPGHTFNTTVLVHEAYLRLVGDEKLSWENRAHFFGAAAEAMLRILIDRARRRQAPKHGGRRKRVAFEDDLAQQDPGNYIDILSLNEALAKLEARDARRACVVKYRFLLGLSVAETAEMLGVSRRTIDDDWAFCKAWLRRELANGDTSVE